MSVTTSGPGRSVIVTGAGSGIGRAVALRFAAEGARVVIADVDPASAGKVAGEVAQAGGTAVTVIGDLRDQAVVDRVAATAAAEFGGIDVLVNNAGVMDSMSAAADTGDDEWERVIGINLTAPFRLTRAVLPHMLAVSRGAIVFTASEASLRGSAAGAAYTASKHGIAGLTKSLAVMYRDKGIRTNAIAPGGTLTNIRVDADRGAHGPAALALHGQRRHPRAGGRAGGGHRLPGIRRGEQHQRGDPACRQRLVRGLRPRPCGLSPTAHSDAHAARPFAPPLPAISAGALSSAESGGSRRRGRTGDHFRTASPCSPGDPRYVSTTRYVCCTSAVRRTAQVPGDRGESSPDTPSGDFADAE